MNSSPNPTVSPDQPYSIFLGLFSSQTLFLILENEFYVLLKKLTVCPPHCTTVLINWIKVCWTVKIHVIYFVVVFHTQETDWRRFPEISVHYALWEHKFLNISLFTKLKWSRKFQSLYTLYSIYGYMTFEYIFIEKDTSIILPIHEMKAHRVAEAFTFALNHRTTWRTSYFNTYWNRKFYKVFLSIKDWIAQSVKWMGTTCIIIPWVNRRDAYCVNAKQ